MTAVKTALTLVKSCYKFPIIIILGSTGVGKTKLSIELAKHLDGEIVGADSMQVYKGLDVITAKATLEERSECRHHMIDVIEPLENFSVVKYRNMALPVIEDIASRGKLPIIVGGTNYYIESILWDTLVTNEGLDFSKASQDSAERTQLKTVGTEIDYETQKKRTKHVVGSDLDEYSGDSTGCTPMNVDFDKSDREKYYQHLQSIDPKTASRIHPNDMRKVKRQLQIRELTGRLPSEIISEQHSKEGADHLGGPLRFTNALVFWLTCEQIALEKRLCSRVDEMLANGLVDEISNFYRKYTEDISTKCDAVLYSEGIFQTIGFKEFHEYLTSETKTNDEREKLLCKGIETLKRTTIRYSKKQKTWVRNRFLKRPLHSSPDVYELDTTIVENWDEAVSQPALQAAESFLNGGKIDLDPLERQPKDTNDDSHKHYVCKACGDKLIVGDSVWREHCQ